MKPPSDQSQIAALETAMRCIRYGEKVPPRERDRNCEVLEFIRAHIVNARAASSLRSGANILEDQEASK